MHRDERLQHQVVDLVLEIGHFVAMSAGVLVKTSSVFIAGLVDVRPVALSGVRVFRDGRLNRGDPFI